MTSRRTFIKQSGLAVAAFAVAPSWATCKPKSKSLGIQLYTLRDQIKDNVTGVIEKVAKAGYSYVETFGYENGKFWGKEVSELKSILDGNGLKTPSGHYNVDPFLKKKGTDDDFKFLLDVANTLKQEYITIPFMFFTLRTSADDYRRIAEKLNRAGELCKSAGLKVAYHNHDFEFDKFGGEIGYDILLKNTDPALVSYEMDLYWVVKAGHDPVALFNRYPGRFKMWHVKDMDREKPRLNTEIGSGSLNFKKIFNAQKASGVKYYFVEQENFKIDPFQSIKQSFDYANKHLL